MSLKRTCFDESLLSEDWTHIQCPNCNEMNWVYLCTNPVDGTGVDPDGFFCGSCKAAVFWDQELLEANEKSRDKDLEHILHEGKIREDQ